MKTANESRIALSVAYDVERLKDVANLPGPRQPWMTVQLDVSSMEDYRFHVPWLLTNVEMIADQTTNENIP
ncbi:hypothetical protein Y032_0401g777 [Ancylostoma ceylanicum]|uniref:Uncharacterized protein n=1 Tax=Ancylostoma ceylanicum TaxID=53326 RepID=A0A016X432_9BILA|nr:hypothetical protein Y032_0401g777 [Ancylostoma ceylanicum]